MGNIEQVYREFVDQVLNADSQVLARWPDGTLHVQFDNAAKNRLVWPSFLDRRNGQWR